MNELLSGLRAAGEPTRLRLLALCAHGEFSVSELVHIVGQSQPRVSRHLKLLVESGLLERFREGTQVFFRISARGNGADLARTLVDLIPSDDTEINRDLGRVDAIRERRAAVAEQYFQRIAEQWDDIRSLHVSQHELETSLLELVGQSRVEDYLDIGTGTGQVLSLLSSRVDRGVGVDLSREMLNLARSNLERNALRNVQVRHADMYNLPLADESFDLITVHLVLHYAHNPENVISEASRVLKPGGRLFIIDFSKHQELDVCEQHQHVHPGFTDKAIAQICRDQKLTCKVEKKFEGNPLTTVIWRANKPALAA